MPSQYLPAAIDLKKLQNSVSQATLSQKNNTMFMSSVTRTALLSSRLANQVILESG